MPSKPFLGLALALATSAACAQAPAVRPAPASLERAPQVMTSFPPAALVRINGPAVMVPTPGSSGMQRVGNTRALILLARMPNDPYSSERPIAYYLKVRDGWMGASFLPGRWKRSSLLPFLRRQRDAGAAPLEKSGDTVPVDVSTGGDKGPMPSIFVAESEAELVVFSGPPRYVPIAGTGLLRADNADRDLVMDRASRILYLAYQGQWLTAPALEGPWAFLDAAAVPAELAKVVPRGSK